MVKNFLSEDDIEQALLQNLQHLYGFDVLDCLTSSPDEINDGSRRSDKRDVVFADRLQAACEALNPGIPVATIEQVVAKVTDRRNAMSVIAANRELDGLIREGVSVEFDDAAGIKQHEVVRLIDFDNPANNKYLAVSQLWIQSSVQAPKAGYRRPDVILYINGLPLVFIELKNSNVKLRSAYDDNLFNYKHDIPQLFHCNAFCLLSNAIETKVGSFTAGWEHFFNWLRVDNEKEQVNRKAIAEQGTSLELAAAGLCQPHKLLDYMENFILFHKDTNKIIAQNHQFMGVNSAFERFLNRDKHDGKLGVFWHTQGSGKSLTMVWLAKWLREHINNTRVLIVTDRTELDEQIEAVFDGVEESIYRTKSGADLLATLNKTESWLLCSLVHKFGRQAGDADTDNYLEELKSALPKDFKAKGKLFVFVDECHRTQSGKLHQAMKSILPEALFVGFSGTPLLKKDKQKSIEIFGSYIHSYKFDEAVTDGVVLDLQYEARDIDQYITSQDKIDQWFDVKTRGLSDMAKVQLKQKWGTMKKVLSSLSRLEKIVNDILLDMDTRPRLMEGRGNAMLVCSSIYQACKVYELFNTTELKGKCAIVTSYLPSAADLKGEESGEGYTEKLHQYEIYQQMLADYFEIDKDEAIKKAEEFEKRVKGQFKKEPGQMRLLIVVDKLLTGFDAPSATYLYIDKKMQDHGLFQAICRVNRIDGGDKEYGYIVDYKDLFHSLETSIGDYTSGAFDAYDNDDVAGLFSNRLDTARDKLEEARETIKALCEPVLQPKALIDYIHYFCGDVANKDDLKLNEARRVSLYKNVAALVRAYANIANEIQAAGYSLAEAKTIKEEVEHYSKMRQEIKLAARDEVDMKQYEPAMRRLLDTYIRAEDSEPLIDFEEMGLIELIVNKAQAEPTSTADNKVPEAMAETIENNMRKIIIDEQPINPRYYEKMSELLDALIAQRRQDVIAYEEYLRKVKELANQIEKPQTTTSYPDAINTRAKQSLYDNLDKNENLVTRIDAAVRYTKKADWKHNRFKQRDVENSVSDELCEYKVKLDEVMTLIKNQSEYD